MKNNLVIAAIPEYRFFAQQVATTLGLETVPLSSRVFADGNVWFKYNESIRESYLYVIGSTDGSPPSGSNLKLEQLKQLLSAGVLASAVRIIAVMPYWEERQDRKDEPRTDIIAARVAREIMAAGATRIITMDLHASQAQGFFYPVPVDHLYSSYAFMEWYKSQQEIRFTDVCSPDVGGSKRAEKYAQFLDANLVFTFKGMRKAANKSRVLGIAGTPTPGGCLLIVDDAIDTGGTFVNAVERWREAGVENIYGFVPHPIMSTDRDGVEAIYRVEQSHITKLLVTDSIPLKRQSPKIDVISVVKLFAEAIKGHFDGTGISHRFLENQ